MRLVGDRSHYLYMTDLSISKSLGFLSHSFKGNEWDKKSSDLEIDKFMVWKHHEGIYEEASQQLTTCQ